MQEDINKEGNLPRHIAVIMDGNGRWAVERGLTRTEGHQEGIESVRDIVKASSQIGIKYLTLYAFSIENWKRPITEVGVLMKLLEHYLRQELVELHQNNVRLRSIGKSSSLPKVVQRLLHEAFETTKDNTGLTLTLALSYSGRWDIVRSVQMIALDVRRGKVSPEDINEELFSHYLQTDGIPEPDLLIRTSGEMRLSNFLLWEMAYGEMYITDKFWPEFRRNDLYDALLNFMNRERRFGKTSAQVASEKYVKQKDTYLQRVVNAIKGK
ncbi:MAG: isoprenyl transferase [Ignavibacteriae bacterium]|nr:isoprenyl transferase [Ignavibacteriota bacterium]